MVDTHNLGGGLVYQPYGKGVTVAKLLTDSIIPELKSKVLTDTDGSVKASNIDWEIQQIQYSYINPKVVNDQLKVFRYGKLVLISGVFQINGAFTPDEVLYQFSDFSVVQRLIDDVWVMASNRIFFNGTATTYSNSWQHFTGFGFIA